MTSCIHIVLWVFYVNVSVKYNIHPLKFTFKMYGPYLKISHDGAERGTERLRVNVSVCLRIDPL